MPFATKKSFERLLIAAVLIEILHLIGLFERRTAVDGVGLALVFSILVPWVPLALGLAVTRLGSTAAKWLLVAMVALAWIAGTRAGIGGWWTNPAIFLGVIAGILQTLAALMLFTPEGRGWTRKPGAAEAAPPQR